VAGAIPATQAAAAAEVAQGEARQAAVVLAEIRQAPQMRQTAVAAQAWGVMAASRQGEMLLVAAG